MANSGIFTGDYHSRKNVEIASTRTPLIALLPDRGEIGNFETITGWTALSNDTTGIAVDLAHVLGSLSLEFDKVDGGDNEKFAGVEATIDSLDYSRFIATDKLTGAFYVSTIALIDYAFVRLGTDSSNYQEWRVEDTLPIVPAIWHVFDVTLAATQIAVTGNGWNPAAITYVCVGVMFDAENNALADIRWDHLVIRSAALTT